MPCQTRKARVFFGSLVSELPVPIDFISNTPIGHTVRRIETVLTAQASQGGVLRAVAIFHPVASLAHVTITAVHYQKRLRPYLAAESDKFVGAKRV